MMATTVRVSPTSETLHPMYVIISNAFEWTSGSYQKKLKSLFVFILEN